MLITDLDQAQALEAISNAIEKKPDEFNGVKATALPQLALCVASALTNERHRVLRYIDEHVGSRDLQEIIADLKRPK